MKRTKLKPVSKKMSRQKRLETELKRKLIIACGGNCQICGKHAPYLLQKHEIKTRAEGGDPLDPNNCLMLCPDCHWKETLKKGASEKTKYIRDNYTYKAPIPKWLES